jgi:hypothetical protein
MSKNRQDLLVDGSYKGFFMEINEVFDYDLTSYELLVRLYLARCASSKDGIAFPSHKTIAEAIGCGKMSVIRAIEGLIEKGWLLKKSRRKKKSLEKDTNLYKLVIPSEVLDARIEKMRNAASAGDDPFADHVSDQDCPVDNSEGVVSERDQVVSERDQVVSEVDSIKTYLKKPTIKSYNHRSPESDTVDNPELAACSEQNLFDDSDESSILTNNSKSIGLNGNTKKHEYSSEFESFWREYPCKTGKYAAFLEYQKVMKKEKGIHDYDLLSAARKYAQHCSDTDTFPKHGSTFLNHNKKWYLDWISGTQESEQLRSSGRRTDEEEVAYLKAKLSGGGNN